MRLHYLQHAPFECLGTIKKWALGHGISLSRTQLFNSDPLPLMDSFDCLVIMGGPMNVDETHEYPWLVQEKEFVAKAILSGKKILGICLGAQLLAEALGARVKRNHVKEIGWFDVTLSKEAQGHQLFEGLPPVFVPFHWHGDTFDLPSGATRLASSAVTKEQGFLYRDQVLGLQFHLEVDPLLVTGLTKRFPDQLQVSKSIQCADTLLKNPECFEDATKWMSLLLTNFFLGKS